MRDKAYSITAAALLERGREDIPEELLSSKHLIYSSPATLAYNSPGAQGFGVKRAGLAIPGSVMLLLAPGCCGRNTTILSELGGYSDRFFYLMMDETDIVTGRHLRKVPQAVAEICDSLIEKPSVVMICLTCVDALLGTDMERICKKAQKKIGIPVLPCYMYALTREGRKPPMVHVRQSIYSLLAPRKRKGTSVNILGHFAPLEADCELYALLRSLGVRTIREIAHCESYEDYLAMAEANFNLVLDPEARFAAADMQKRLGIPYIELTRLYQIDKIKRQYQLFAAALGGEMDDGVYEAMARRAVEEFRAQYPEAVFSIGEGCNANAFELALALIREGFSVAEIFANIAKEDFVYVEKIAALSPKTRIYSNLEPSMIYYEPGERPVDLVIGKDAAYYHPEAAAVTWSDDIQPFGYVGVCHFFAACAQALAQKEDGGESDILSKKQMPEVDAPKEETREATAVEAEDREAQSWAVDARLKGGISAETRGFRKYIAPFAPDQSGAAAVLCALGGMTVILDAGGCAGNICGFDEPRWFSSRSAIFSAGLRDMDAILGRDDRLVEKVEKACAQIDARFVAVIGTPVPAVIGTDYRALSRMIEKKVQLPALAIDTSGTALYDVGEERAWLALFRAFAKEGGTVKRGRLGVIGATPLAFGGTADLRALEKHFQEKGYEEVCVYGMGAGISAIETAAQAQKNIVVSPAGRKAAEYLKQKFGTPYELFCPPEVLPEWSVHRERLSALAGKRVLVVHQQTLANSVRAAILAAVDADVQVASWFMMSEEMRCEGDIALREEADWIRLVREGGYDVIIADPLLRRAVPAYDGDWWELSHYAVSGKARECL